MVNFDAKFEMWLKTKELLYFLCNNFKNKIAYKILLLLRIKVYIELLKTNYRKKSTSMHAFLILRNKQICKTKKNQKFL